MFDVCASFFVFVASAFNRFISPLGSIKCIVSFHLISSLGLWPPAGQENVNNINVACR